MAYSAGSFSEFSYSDSVIAVEIALAALGGEIEIVGGNGTVVAGVGRILTANGSHVDIVSGTGSVTTGIGQILIASGGVVEIEGGDGSVFSGTGQLVFGTGGVVEIVETAGEISIGQNLESDSTFVDILGAGELEAGVDIDSTGDEIEIIGGNGILIAGASSELTAVGGILQIAAGIGFLVIGQILTASGGQAEIVGGQGSLLTGTGQQLVCQGGEVEVAQGTGSFIAGTGQQLVALGTHIDIARGTATIVVGAQTQSSGEIEIAQATGAVLAGAGQILEASGGVLEAAGGAGGVTAGATVTVPQSFIDVFQGIGSTSIGTSQELTGIGGILEIARGTGSIDLSQGQQLTALGTTIFITEGTPSLYVDAPYGPKYPTPGNLNELLEDQSAALQWIFIAYPYDAETDSEVPLRYSSHGLTTSPNSAEPNVFFASRLKDFQFSRGFWSGNRVFGGSDSGDGVVVLDNEDGGLNSWGGTTTDGERRYHFRWRYAEVLLGHENWDYEDFIQMWGGQIEDAQFNQREIIFQLRDRLDTTDRAFQTDLFTGDRKLIYSSTSVSVSTGAKTFNIPNHVVNGDFATSISGWGAGTGWTWISAVATRTSAAISDLTQTVPTANGNLYYVRVNVDVATGTLAFLVEGTQVGETMTSTGTYVFAFTAEGANTDIAFRGSDGFTGSLDDVIIRLDGEISIGDIVRLGQTGALTTRWMEGTVQNWNPVTGDLELDVTKSGGTGASDNWSLWIRPYEGETDWAGKPKPIVLGTTRFVEVQPMGAVQGIFMSVISDAPTSILAAYDGTAVLTQVSTFPPAANEVYFDSDNGVLWWATEPTFPLTVTIGATGGSLFTKRIYSTPGTYIVTIPTGVNQVDVKLWGAGGGAGDLGYGGAGAFVKGSFSVSPGDTLQLSVPGGGKRRSSTQANPSSGPPLVYSAGGTSAYGIGGTSYYNSDWTVSSTGIGFWNDFGTKWTGGGGGGAAAIVRSPYNAETLILAVAGGGGGASGDYHGGAAGLNGDDGGGLADRGGKGATPTAAGAGGTTESSTAYTNGNSGISVAYRGNGGNGASVLFSSGRIVDGCPGGGGGGRRGGGSGASDFREAGAGGGGSSQAPAIGGTVEDGSSTVPGGVSDPDYIAGTGVGGVDGILNGYGGDGVVIMSWTATIPAGDQPNAAELLVHVLRDRLGFRHIEKTSTDLGGVTANSGTKTFTFVSADLTSIGMDVGDVVSFSGLSANNDFGYTITTLTSTTITVKESITTIASAETGYDLITGDIDGPSLKTLNAFSAASLGRYYVAEISGRQVLDEILNTVGAAIYVNRKGLISFAVIDTPSSTAVLEFTDDNLVDITREPVGRPVWRLRLGARRCYRVHDQVELAASGAQADKDFARQEWREGVHEQSGYLAKDPASDDLFVETLFDSVDDAFSEAVRRLPLLSPARLAYKLELDAEVWKLKVGDTIRLSSDHLGISAKNFLVVEISEEASLDGGRIVVLG